jgi:type VI secretion system protein ImpJ
MVARMGISHPWGVVAAEFDDAALALSRLNAIRLVVRFRTARLLIRTCRCASAGL